MIRKSAQAAIRGTGQRTEAPVQVPRARSVVRVFLNRYLIAVLMLASLVAGTPTTRHRIVVSTRNFAQYFTDFNKVNNLNPVERFVFSLALANTDPSQAR
jgi:hypothetical protein